MIPWWFGYLLGEIPTRWSDEEIRVHTRIWGIALTAYLLLLFGGIFVAHRLGFRTGIIAPVLAISVPLAVYLGRRLSTLFWPTLTKVADENAAQRLAKKSRDRQN